MSNKRRVFIILVAVLKYSISISILFLTLNKTFDSNKEILDQSVLFWILVILPWIIGFDSIYAMVVDTFSNKDTKN